MMNLQEGRVCQTGELLSSCDWAGLGWGSRAGQRNHGWAGGTGFPESEHPRRGPQHWQARLSSLRVRSCHLCVGILQSCGLQSLRNPPGG